MNDAIHDSDLVDQACACPGCGERRADELVWQNDEDEQVRCSTCGMIYSPSTVEGRTVYVPDPAPKVCPTCGEPVTWWPPMEPEPEVNSPYWCGGWACACGWYEEIEPDKADRPGE